MVVGQSPPLFSVINRRHRRLCGTLITEPIASNDHFSLAQPQTSVGPTPGKSETVVQVTPAMTSPGAAVLFNSGRCSGDLLAYRDADIMQLLAERIYLSMRKAESMASSKS